MLFQLEDHLKKYSDHLFFDEKTYSQLSEDLLFFSELFKNHETSLVGLQFKSSYLSFAALLGALLSGKIGVLISPLETSAGVQRLASQAPFNRVWRDEDYDKTSQSSLHFNSRKALSGNSHAAVVFSSGSSGAPKGVVLSFANFYFSAKGFSEYILQKNSDVTLMNLPHHHVGGLMTLWRAFFSGGSLISSSQLPFNLVSLVPLQLSLLLKDEEQLSRLKQCRVILVGGAKLSSSLKSEAEALGLKLFETYGMSETCSLVSLNWEVLPYREVAVDSDHKFIVKGRTLAVGLYQNGLFEKLPLDCDGWYKTQDIGTKVNDLFVFSHRSDLIFVSGGENINPLLIEEILRTHPDIADAYVVPINDEKWGQRGIGLFETRVDAEPLTEENLKAFLKDKIHPFHIPKNFFQTTLSFEGQLKPKRSELSFTAEKLYLHSLFSYSFIENVNRPLIVFLHGFTGDKDDFLFLGRDLKKNYSLLRIDLPGHGKTLSRHFFSTTDLFTRLSQLITLFSSSPILYGYSMGGRVALQLALSFLRPSILFLESVGPGLSSKEENELRRQTDLEQFAPFSDSKTFLQNWYMSDLFKSYRTSASFESDLEKKSAHNLSEWKDSQKILSQGLFPLKAENLEGLKKGTFDVYYLYGSEDQKYKEYAPLFKNSIEISGASHNPHKTHPDEIRSILKKILK